MKTTERTVKHESHEIGLLSWDMPIAIMDRVEYWHRIQGSWWQRQLKPFFTGQAVRILKILIKVKHLHAQDAVNCFVRVVDHGLTYMEEEVDKLINPTRGTLGHLMPESVEPEVEIVPAPSKRRRSRKKELQDIEA